MYRTAKLVPWYYHTKPQCEAEIRRDNAKCSFSATHTGYPTSGREVQLCTIHARMADFPVKLIQPEQVLIRED